MACAVGMTSLRAEEVVFDRCKVIVLGIVLLAILLRGVLHQLVIWRRELVMLIAKCAVEQDVNEGLEIVSELLRLPWKHQRESRAKCPRSLEARRSACDFHPRTRQ